MAQCSETSGILKSLLVAAACIFLAGLTRMRPSNLKKRNKITPESVCKDYRKIRVFKPLLCNIQYLDIQLYLKIAKCLREMDHPKF